MVQPKDQQIILLHPESFVVTPDLRVESAVYRLDINSKGDGEVEVDVKAENISRSIRKAIKYEFWGREETTWDSDVHVEMWDEHGKPLQIQYKGKGESPLAHSWLAILNEDLSPGQTVRIKGKYRWENLVNINKDDFTYELQLPTIHLGVEVIFPKDFPPDSKKLLRDVKFLEITDEEPRIALRSTMLAHTNKIKNRLNLCSDCYDLSPGHIYRLEWNTTKYINQTKASRLP